MMSSRTYLNTSNTVSRYFDIDLKCTVVEKEYTVYNRDVFECIKKNKWPGIPEIFEISESEDVLTVREKWIDGIDLESLVRVNGPMEEDQVIEILVQLCQILEPLHDNNIIHRDIKPSNVLQTDRGVILIDFNAGKIINALENRDTVLLGTTGFAAPEQYGFRASSRETDIYGLGALAQYLLGENAEETAEMSGILMPVIHKCMELDPSDRYTSVKYLKYALLEGVVYDECPPYKPYHKYYPVGFRSGKLLNMILSSMYYFLIFYFGLNLQVVGQTENGATLGQMRFAFILVCLLPVYFSFNYLNIQQKLEIKRNKNLTIFLTKMIIYNFIIVFLVLFFLAIIFTILR